MAQRSIKEKIDKYLISEIRLGPGSIKSDEQWQEFLQAMAKRAQNKKMSRTQRRMMDDQKFVNKLKIFLGLRTPTKKE